MTTELEKLGENFFNSFIARSLITGLYAVAAVPFVAAPEIVSITNHDNQINERLTQDMEALKTKTAEFRDHKISTSELNELKTQLAERRAELQTAIDQAGAVLRFLNGDMTDKAAIKTYGYMISQVENSLNANIDKPSDTLSLK